jgi:hypothetical protein
MLVLVGVFLQVSIITSSLLILVGCQTAPTKYETIDKGKWKSKLLVRDIRAGRSQIVNVDIIAVRPSKLRMEAVTSLGIHVASFVINGDQMKYILPREKKFYSGTATKQSMKSVIGVELDPKLLMNLIFEDAPPEKAWNCIRDEKGYLEDCINKKEQVKISWSDRDQARKRIALDSPQYQIQLSMADFSTKVEDKPELFDIVPPDDFKKN